MKKSRTTAFILSAILCTGCITGCGKNKEGSSSADDTKGSSAAETTQSSGTGEIIYPAEDSEEYELGAYRISENGIKLYFNESEYPAELMNTLEGYFKCYETGDFEAYKEYIFPSYIETMEKHLQENYQYGLDTSFQTQCDNLNENMGGSFEITRIKIEPPLETESEEVGADAFLDNLNEFFGFDYKSSVKADSDNLRYMTFNVMAKDTEGNESLIVSGFYILFAEKDGRYYTFG